ncbi:MAG: hypothetical protein K2P69_03025 [Eubacterium sp.]|nr:hypothetical protein [Eubacterium sp.]
MMKRDRTQIRNNYDYLLERMKEENINYVDAKTIHLDEAEGIPIFAKTGYVILFLIKILKESQRMYTGI